jgi:hypothetical protein
MKPRFTMRRALDDPLLLGSVLAGDSWNTWRTMLIATMGEQLTDDERAIFARFTGREREPGAPIEEGAFIIGRRGGKDRAISVLVTYLASCCSYDDVLSRGEKGLVLCLSADQRQGRITLDHIAANFEQSPILAQLVTSRTTDAIELSNKVIVEVRAASYRRLRGITAVAIVASEIAFWHDDETSSNPAEEILAAVRPALSTTGGPLLMISTPYRKAGTLWDIYDRHYGANGSPSILVAKGTTTDFNPTFPQAVIDRAIERDAALNSAEYLVEWRSDLEAYVSREVVRSCVDDDIFERAPEDHARYFGFVDPAGGSGTDSMTLAIAHRQQDNIIVLDCLREWRPPFNPVDIVSEAVQVCQNYRVGRLYGDRFAGEWCRLPFREAGVGYEISAQSKTDLYINSLPLLNAGRVRLLDHQRLIGQLISLERTTTRGTGRDVVDHPRGAHDDVANAAVGVISRAKHGGYPTSLDWVSGPPDEAAAAKEAREYQDARLNAHILRTGGYWNAVRGGWRF